MSRPLDTIKAERDAAKSELGASYNTWAKLKAAADKLDAARRKLADVESEVGCTFAAFSARRTELADRLDRLNAEYETARNSPAKGRPETPDGPLFTIDQLAHIARANLRINPGNPSQTAWLAELEQQIAERDADVARAAQAEAERLSRIAQHERDKSALEAVWYKLNTAEQTELAEFIRLGRERDTITTQERLVAEWIARRSG